MSVNVLNSSPYLKVGRQWALLYNQIMLNSLSVNQPDTKIKFLPTASLQPNPFQPRAKLNDDTEFQELIHSIAAQGILEPLVVVETPAGIHIVAGERRWRAAKKLNIKQLPVHVVKTSPKGMLEMAIVENIQRVDLNSLERAQALKRLMNEFHYTYEQLGERLGKSRQYAQATIQLLELPDPVKDGLNKGLISESHARAILGAGSRENMIQVYRQTVAEGASVRRTEALARYKKQHQLQPYQQRTLALTSDDELDNWSQKLEADCKKQLVSTAKVKLTDTSKSTKILIVLKGDVQSRQKDLAKLAKILGKKK